jgi:transketolase
MRPSIRLAALMELRVVYVFTHDSIGLGEDGPTHQPIEHLAALRAIPNLTVIRPADANETAMAWMEAMEHEDGPVALSLTRQSLPTLDREEYGPADGLRKGAYVLADLGDSDPDLILMASGSEVELILSAGEKIAEEGIAVRIVSFPSWELFSSQDEAYRESVFPEGIKARIAIEAGSPMGWERWTGSDGRIIGIDHYGASAPYQEIYQRFGLTTENIIDTVHDVLETESSPEKVS